VFQHCVNVEVAQIGHNSLLHSPVINALKVLREQGFIPVFNSDLG